MAEPTPNRTPGSLLRNREGARAGRVDMVELFFDLVFVFAVTQLSHALVADLTAGGALRTALLLGAVWWAWIDTSWVTNWLDPERALVRVAVFGLMLGGLALSVSVPKAFGEHGLVFAVAFFAMQVGRTLFFLWAVRHERESMRRNYQRILVWLVISSGLWVVGGLADPDHRMAIWSLALALEFLAPALFYHVPGLGRSTLADWDVDGSHMAERCALFVIIALGESLLVSGAAFSAGAWTAATVGALAISFVGTLAMWWLYFDKGADAGHDRIVQSSAPGRHARLGYTYLHLPIVAGIILAAVADELLLAHPDHATDAGLVAIVGGPALYLLGVAAFKWASTRKPRPPLSHLVGMALFALLAAAAATHELSPLALAAAAAAVLVIVAVWEQVAMRGKPQTKAH